MCAKSKDSTIIGTNENEMEAMMTESANSESEANSATPPTKAFPIIEQSSFKLRPLSESEGESQPKNSESPSDSAMKDAGISTDTVAISEVTVETETPAEPVNDEVNDENLTAEGTPPSEETERTSKIRITGSGYHRKLIHLHILSIGLIWLLLRFTFMSSVDPVMLTPWVITGSIFLSISIHMISFRNFFQTIAETEEILGLMKKHVTQHFPESPLTDDKYYEGLEEMLGNGSTSLPVHPKGSVKFMLLNDDNKGKEVALYITQNV